ncbi:hypothetical protein A3850_015225 [Lewinella sp. 4G2]|nr:hypothetical protein A3850_015225 [Lewinella sp. 4G2]
MACLPPSDPYPFAEPDDLVMEAEAISEGLTEYIRAWHRGDADARIPANLIPAGITDSKDFYLKRPEDVEPGETWATRFARPVDLDSLRGGIPEPKATYLFLGTALAPFGSKMIIEGEFPRARFFSFQITAPFNGREYYAERQFGQAEVSLVDADIEPLPGHVNPFRLGADRTAENRSYRFEIDLVTGDPVAQNDNQFVYPYRIEGNRLAGALLVHQGVLGYKDILQQPRAEPAPWNLGALWVRIYRPDDGTGPLGGVEMPRVSYELATGERFFIGSDFSTLQARADTTVPNQNKVTAANPNYGPNEGFYKSWGISRSILSGVAVANGWNDRDSARRVADVHLGWTGRGEFQAAPANYEPHATTNNYCNYLGRNIDLLPGQVVVLTGKLPTFPDTGPGAATMESGQVRFWSIGGIDPDPLSPLPATTIHSIADEEVIIDADRKYIIVYSRPEDRPANATAANGINWVNAGTQSNHGLMLRWVSVRDKSDTDGSAEDWYTSLAPSEDVVDWSVGDWAGSAYDPKLIGTNWWEGHMSCYLPRYHTMPVTEFEALGGGLRMADVPVWLDERYEAGPAFSVLGSVVATSQLDADNSADKAIDGDINTTWSNAFGSPEDTVTLTLDTLRGISAIRLLWNPFFFGTEYILEASVDGSNWRILGDYEETSGGVKIYRNFDRQPARYVRLITKKVSSTWSSLAEFEVYDNDCECPSEPPTSTTRLMDSDIEFRVYPNPSNGLFQISAEGQIQSIEVWDNQGRLLRRDIETEATLDLRGYESGIYLLKVQVGDATLVKRVIIH